MNVATLDMHQVVKVTVQQSKTYERSSGDEFTMREITIEHENGNTVTVQLYGKGDELKVEIN